MGLKDWLWNDNASELFRPSGSELPQGSERAKNSPSFISTLLFGDEESRGMLKTIGKAIADNSSESNLSSTEMEYRSGPEGDGYYMKGGSSKWYD